MTPTRRSRWIHWLLVLALPLLLLAANLRLVTGHWFVRWEYRRAGFPADPFGLSTAERIRLAEVCQDFLASDTDISLLADLRLPGGEPAFNERELRHMADVQAVYRGLTVAGVAAALLWTGVSIALLTVGQRQRLVPTALLSGGLFTLGLLSAVGAFMLVSWGQFFTTFHRLFFEGETWIFPPSDTLIRLFPIRFWIDIAATIVGLLVIEGVLATVVGWIWRRRQARQPDGQGHVTA
ncbi:MAG: TIGR01906 family membrane protein [Chloroflexota bacterium]|nr:TIGR01906 family membrane protein [Chloroflexota bacterium]